MMRVPAAVVMLWVMSAPALADGMAFQTMGAQVEVRATEQRAVMWLRDSTWEIHIQPVFERGLGRSAWVVPFAMQPEVHLGSADFFDQLELLTSPVFIQVCSQGGSGFGCCFLVAAGGDSGEPQAASAHVRVWERGTVGELDYVVISSEDGSHLVEWLDAEGFELPEEAGDLIESFETEGAFFFAARLSEEADPDKPLHPVRFVLPGVDVPAYPMRLTRLGVVDGGSLDLTLWVITPQDGYAPEVGYQPIDSHPRSREEYDAALEKIFAMQGSATTLALLYKERFFVDPRLDHMFCSQGYMCIPFLETGVEAPGSWCDEIQQIRSAASWISRYQGRFTPPNMAEDLALKQENSFRQQSIWNVYEVWTCDEQLATMGFVALVFVGLAFHRRRRR